MKNEIIDALDRSAMKIKICVYQDSVDIGLFRLKPHIIFTVCHVLPHF